MIRSAIIVAIVATATSLGCGKVAVDGDADADASKEAAPQACSWQLPDGGNVQCPLGAAGCPGPDGCNVCKCYLDGTYGCTTHSCP